MSAEPETCKTVSPINLIGGISCHASIKCIEQSNNNLRIVTKPIHAIKPDDYVFTGVNQIYTKVLLVLKYSDTTPCMRFHCDNNEIIHLSNNQLMYQENNIIPAKLNEFYLPEPHLFGDTLYTLVLADIHRIQVDKYNLLCCFHEFLSDQSTYDDLTKINIEQNYPNQIDLSKMHFLINPQTKKILHICKSATNK